MTGSGGIRVSGDGTISFESPSIFEVTGESGVIVSGYGTEVFEWPSEYEVVSEGGIRVNFKGEVSYSDPKFFELIASGGIETNFSGITEFIGRDDLPLLEVIGAGGVDIKGRGLCEHIDTDELPIFVAIGAGGVKIRGTGIVSLVTPSIYEITSVAKLKIGGVGITEFSVPAKIFEAVSTGGLDVSGRGFTIFLRPPTLEIMASGGIVVSRPVDVAAIYHTWVVAGMTFEPSIYSGFDFNSYTIYRGKAYGLKSDGLYLLEGDTDNGTDIHTGIDLGEKSFRGTSRKKIRSISVIDGSADLNVKVSDGTRDGYYTLNSDDKAIISRKIRGGKIAIKVADFDEVDAMGIEVVDRGY